MPISTTTFATNLASLLGLDAGHTTSLISLVLSWDPTTPTDLASAVQTLVTNVGLRDTSYNAYLTGTPTGGPLGDGNYPVNLLGGGTMTLPCPAKVQSLITHGADAQTGIVLDVLGPYNNSELLRMIVVPGPLIVNPGATVGYCKTVATSDSVFVLKKNGAAWGTITFVAGQHAALVASFSSANLIAGDVVELYAPTVVDATLANFSFTIPGV
jgi:hypothetical protein